MTGGTHWRSGDYRITEKSRDYFEMSGGEQPASARCDLSRSSRGCRYYGAAMPAKMVMIISRCELVSAHGSQTDRNLAASRMVSLV
jgi:hypothetical protein